MRGWLWVLLIAGVDDGLEAGHARAPVLQLSEQRLQAYANCREQLDPLAIRAILEAHERNAKRVRRFEQMPLPVYGDNLIEWLLDEGDPELERDRGDPFMGTSAKLEAGAMRCGIGTATAYWQTARSIAAVLDERRYRRPGAGPADEAASALVDRFLGKLGLCTGNGKLGQGAVVCWGGVAIVSEPCPPDMNFGSTGYVERDGICYNPVGRPSGPRLRKVCSRHGEVRRDVPAYPVLCEEGVRVHVVPCSKDADCGRYALPRFCSRGLCYARHADKDRAVTRQFH